MRSLHRLSSRIYWQETQMACSNHHRTQSAIGGVPIHPMLVAFPIPFLMSALATDIAFWRNGDHHSLVLASMWALATAMMMGTLEAVIGLIEFYHTSRSLVGRRLSSFSGRRGGNSDHVMKPPSSACWQSERSDCPVRTHFSPVVVFPFPRHWLARRPPGLPHRVDTGTTP